MRAVRLANPKSITISDAPGEQLYYKDGVNFESFAEAAKSGNPESIVAFSSGIASNGWSWTPAADFFDGDTPQPLGFTPSGRRLGPTGEQHHMLSFIGSHWGNASAPRFSDSQLAEYAKAAAKGEWVQTWDVAMQDDGGFAPEHLAQVQRVLAGLERGHKALKTDELARSPARLHWVSELGYGATIRDDSNSTSMLRDNMIVPSARGLETDDGNASATLRYFGWWGAQVPESTDHTNLFICGTGDPCSMQELLAAKAAGQDCMVSLSNSEEFNYVK